MQLNVVHCPALNLSKVQALQDIFKYNTSYARQLSFHHAADFFCNVLRHFRQCLNAAPFIGSLPLLRQLTTLPIKHPLNNKHTHIHWLAVKLNYNINSHLPQTKQERDWRKNGRSLQSSARARGSRGSHCSTDRLADTKREVAFTGFISAVWARRSRCINTLIKTHQSHTRG